MKDSIENKGNISNRLLMHIITGNIGVFLKEYKPTGKPFTTQIKMEDGRIYFAPSHEFRAMK